MSGGTVCPQCGHVDPLRPRGSQEQADEIARLKAQRDKLLAALNDSKDTLDHLLMWMEDHALPELGDNADGGNLLSVGVTESIETARAAIAEVESSR